MRRALSVVALLTLTLAGLVLMRWVTSVTAAPPLTGQARHASPGSTLPSVPAVGVPEGPASSGAPLAPELIAAHEEALRLGREALAAGDLETARDFYFLAVEALPGETEAHHMLRAVQTALDIGQRRGEWSEAIADLEDLVALAPSSGTVVRAYLDALVGGGREALEQGNAVRAQRLCGEVTFWSPARAEARQCLNEAAARLAPAATAAARTTATPTATATPTRTAAVPPTATTPGPLP